MGDERLLPAYRIRKRGDFHRAFRRRSTAADEWLRVFGHPNELPCPRLGLSVSRKLGGAVARNRWKRRIREAFRRTRLQLPPGIDLVVIPRFVEQPPRGQLEMSLVRLAERVAQKLRR